MRKRLGGLLVLAVAIGAAARVSQAQNTAAPDLDATNVKAAIDRGVAFLMREQNLNMGTWPEYSKFNDGVTALCTLALLNAGVSPDEEHVRKSLAYLRTSTPQFTYVAALETMVFCAARPEDDLPRIRALARVIESGQIAEGASKGAWSYLSVPGAGGTTTGDNSNSQFAILALYEAELAGVQVNERTWRLAMTYWKEAQNDDGSWNYQKEGPAGTGSMTCAGISSLVAAAGRFGSHDAQIVDGQVQCCLPKGVDDITERIDRGLRWMGAHFSVTRNPGFMGQLGAPRQLWNYYYLYGVERVGRMTARRFFVGNTGQHDWYREGTDYLLGEQDKLTGSWQAGGEGPEGNPNIATSLALLFLSKGRRPVIVAKLKFGTDNDWNHHAADVGHLTAYVESKWKRPLTWQMVDLNIATLDDLMQLPVIYISGSKSPNFTDEHLEKLKSYLDHGGFIFAEATCADCKGFDEGFRAAMQKMLPPEYPLALLPREHPIWRFEEKVPGDQLRRLWGVNYGCRTSVVYAAPPQGDDPRGNLSCYWELSQPGRGRKIDDKKIATEVSSALSIGMNVLAYATNREPKYKDEIPQTTADKTPPDQGTRGRLSVANLLHPGGCEAAPAALPNLLEAAAHNLHVRVDTTLHQVRITDEQLFDHHLVFMHGRNSFMLTKAERDKLKQYVTNGGTLFADAICGSREFTESFRREMKAIFEPPLEAIPVTNAMFSPEYGGYDIRTVERREPRPGPADGPLQARLRRVPPELEGIKLGDRYAVIFSKYDLSCALEKHDSLECDGYTRDDAERIGLNVILYSLHE